jgi:galactosamine-6-phosphate isomerase
LADDLRLKPDLLLCLATGASPTRTYELFAQSLASDKRSVRELRILQLDEWGGLERDDPATCDYYLRKHLVTPLQLDPQQCFGFKTDADSPLAECQRIEAWLRTNGPADVCVLGLGVNGHLGFNEPAAHLNPDCHVARLSPESLSHAMLQSARRQPRFGFTLGLREILHSRRILLLVFGRAKAEPLQRALAGPLSTQCPASFLALHPKVTCLCDEAAASLLESSPTD